MKEEGQSMRPSTRRQLIVLGVFLAIYGLLVFLTYLLTPLEQFLPPGQAVPGLVSATPRWQLGAAYALIVLVVYGLLGLAAYWFALRLGLPGIYRERAGWPPWLIRPMLLGMAMGVVLVIGDRFFAGAGSTGGFPHPAFPLSVFASGAAGIGEEVIFRGFVMGLWGLLLSLVLRGRQGRSTALWIANAIAALAFSAGHLPSAMVLLNVTSPAGIPAPILGELFVLNGLLGLVAGERYMRDGLVAAMGIHFWADIVWHVIWPALGLAT